MKRLAVDMRGARVLVTGATGGIGLEAARALAAAGAEVLLVGRDTGRLEAALARVRAAAAGAAAIQGLRADLSSLAEVRALAARVLEGGRPLHVLLNNAGLVLERREVTVDGLEATFATNHLAPFLLTHLLRPALEAAGRARVVTVASEAHRRAALDLADLQFERRPYSGILAYGASKLCNILFTRALARRLVGTGVTATCCHPGVVRTGFGRNNRGAIGWAFRLGAPFLLSAEQGAAPLVHLAASPEVEGLSGVYFKRLRQAEPRRAARSDTLTEGLWRESARLAGVDAA